nr:MAG TPA: hypothetical protein [Caudoviricetes sp.]
MNLQKRNTANRRSRKRVRGQKGFGWRIREGRKRI